MPLGDAPLVGLFNNKKVKNMSHSLDYQVEGEQERTQAMDEFLASDS